MAHPKVTLKQLFVFSVTAKHESVAKAAREIGLSASAISLAVRTLEENVGSILFLRRGKKLLLNDAGRRVLAQAQSMLRHEQELGGQKEAEDARGSLRIGATPMIGHYLLPGICGDYLQRHPLVDIELIVDAQVKVSDAIENATLDIAFVEGPTNRRTTRVLPWTTDRMTFFCRPGHPLARQRTISIKALEGVTWYSQPVGQEARLTIAYAIEKFVPHGSINIRFLTNSVEAIRRAVLASDGIGCLSRRILVDDFKSGRLAELKVREVEIERALSIILRRDLYMSDLQRDFISFVTERAAAAGA